MSGKIKIPSILASLLAWCVLGLYLHGAEPGPESLPIEPEDSVALIHVPEGFEVELVVAEPDVIDPVAFEWGADGRLWVTEMSDYPSGMDGEGKAGGRVRWLKDNDGDGRYEESVLFAEGLSFPTGVLPWKDGVLVTAAPMILYLEDQDGDGVSDEEHVLFDGFHEGNQQLRVNGLVRGLDNWIYCASGAHRSGYGGDSRIISMISGQEVALGSRDFRFNPETGELDPQSGPSQFGRARDDWGNWFGLMNSYPMWHYVLADHYIRRNAHAAAPDPRKQLVLPRNPKVYSFKETQRRFHNYQETGRFTSACGNTVYRDGLLFPDSDMETIDFFTCEPFGNLVQHNRSYKDGVSFTVSTDGPVEKEDGIDFFASKDRWSRPVMAKTGPDGALWIADMYRYMIEHPQWLPKAGQDELRPFYRLGDDRGRIYRVYRKGEKKRPIPNLDRLTSHELVDVLNNRNGWQRDTAQALLVEREDRSIIPDLIELVTQGKEPLGRLHALYALEGLNALNPELLIKGVNDPVSGVRRHAVRLAEPWGNNHPNLEKTVLSLIRDEDAKVRMQLAYSLGEWQGQAVASALGKLAFSDGRDPYMAAAILSSVSRENIADVLEIVLADRAITKRGGSLVGTLIALAIAFDRPATTITAVYDVLQDQGDLNWQFSTVSIVLGALDRKERVERKKDVLVFRIKEELRPLVAKARQLALDNGASNELRIAAIPFLGQDEDHLAEDIQSLGTLLKPSTPAEIQLGAISHLGTLGDQQISGLLLGEWEQYTPSIRTAVLNVIATRVDWVLQLLDEVEANRIPSTELDAGTRQLILKHSNEVIRNRAIQLMPSSNVDRLRTVQQYKVALDLKGDLNRGKEVFKNLCSMCHQLDGVGIEIGPNLAAVSDRSPTALLSGILDPNAAVEGKYKSILATINDGRAILGIITSETGASVTIKDLANQEHVILKSELVSLTNTGRSLMPDGLETSLTQQNLADLIAYVGASE